MIQKIIKNVLASDLRYPKFKEQFIYVTFIVDVIQNTSSGINQINAINNIDIVRNENRFVLSYESMLKPFISNGIPNNLNGYFYNPDLQSVVLSDRLFTDRYYSDAFFKNDITQSNISFLQLQSTQFNTDKEIYLIFRCEIDSNGQLITPCFNVDNMFNDSTFATSDFIFDIQKNADNINVWMIRNVEIHGKSVKNSCNVISNKLGNIKLFNEQFFQVSIMVAPGSLSRGTISSGNLTNKTVINVDVPENGSVEFIMQPNENYSVLAVTDNEINFLNPINPFIVNNIVSNRKIVVNFTT